MSSSAATPPAIPGWSALAAWQRAVLLGAGFLLFAEAGKFLSVRDSTYISFWLPAGLYVAVLLLNETRTWPWLVLGAFAGNLAFDLSHGTTIAAALLFCLTNAVQSVTGAWLVRRFVAPYPTLATLKEFVGFLGLAALLSTAVGAAVGAATLAGFGLSNSFVESWKVWWGSNAMAILLLSPFVLSWCSAPRADYVRFVQPGRLLEAALLLIVLLAVTWHLLFMDLGVMAPNKGWIAFSMLWAGLRFGPLGAAAATLLVSVLVAFFTTQHFAGLNPEQVASGEYIFLMQRLTAAAALLGWIPAIVVGERDRKMLELRESEERLRLLSRRLIEVEETERRNINRELHDRIGQNLATLNLNVGMIRSQLPGEALQAVAPRMNDTQNLLAETMGRVRDLMAELRPVALDDYGLVAALRTHAAEFTKRFATGVSVGGSELAPRLPLSVETALFRIAQEALNNVTKHAYATKVEIQIGEERGSVVLSITDNGLGFDTRKQFGDARNWGMTTMRERAQGVGAALAVESAPGRGTRVEIRISRSTTS
jgi:signal transduction histidine kinase